MKEGQRKNQPPPTRNTAKEPRINFPLSRAEVLGLQIHAPALDIPHGQEAGAAWFDHQQCLHALLHTAKSSS